MRLCLIALLSCLATMGLAGAQTKKSPAVETLSLKSGEELKGFRLAQTRNATVLFVVQRSWLKKALPAKFDLFASKESERDKAILGDYLKRMDLWMEKEQAANKPRAWLDSLKSERKLLEESKPQTQLMVLEFKNSEVRKYTPLQPAYKQLLLVALQQRVENIEGRPAQDLDAEFREAKMDWLREKISLADRLPRFGVENETDWIKRKALFAYSREQGLHLQGSGELLVDARDNKKIDLMGLVQQLGKNALGDLFKDLEPGGGRAASSNWLQQAAKIADEKKVDAVRVTRVVPELSAGRMTVEDAIFARLEDGSLLPIWSGKISGEIAQARPRAEAQIRSDPRLSEVLKQVEKLGLGSQMEQAIKAGAATLELQAQAEQSFSLFLRENTRRLDGPPLGN